MLGCFPGAAWGAGRGGPKHHPTRSQRGERGTLRAPTVAAQEVVPVRREGGRSAERAGSPLALCLPHQPLLRGGHRRAAAQQRPAAAVPLRPFPPAAGSPSLSRARRVGAGVGAGAPRRVAFLQALACLRPISSDRATLAPHERCLSGCEQCETPHGRFLILPRVSRSRVPPCAGDVQGVLASTSFVKKSQLRVRQPRLFGENCLAKLESTSKITATTGGERPVRSFPPPCLLGAFDRTSLPSFSLFLSHSPFVGARVAFPPGNQRRKIV